MLSLNLNKSWYNSYTYNISITYLLLKDIIQRVYLNV